MSPLVVGCVSDGCRPSITHERSRQIADAPLRNNSDYAEEKRCDPNLNGAHNATLSVQVEEFTVHRMADGAAPTGTCGEPDTRLEGPRAGQAIKAGSTACDVARAR
jgi:hypothetical protein